MRKRFEILLAGGALALVGPGCDPREWVVGDPPPPPGVVTPPGNGGPGPGGTGGGAAPGPGTGGPHAVTACAEGAAPIPVRPLDPSLSSQELARRMARLFWARDADPATQLRADTVRTNADVAEMASTMMADGRYSAGLTSFFHNWLELERVRSGTYVEETLLFALDVVLVEDGRLETLLTAPYSFVNEHNAGVYHLPNPGPALRKVMLDPSQRGGLLTQPSRLTRDEFAPARGTFIRNALLCQNMPPSPPDVAFPALTATEPLGLTTRQRIEHLVAGPPCIACHTLIDPPGFAFETFDPHGSFRTADRGQPVDASGAIDLDGRRVTFTTFRELVPALATSCDVRRCVARQMLLHASAIVSDKPPKIDGSLPEVTAAFGSFGWDVRRLMLAVAMSPAFLAP
jgi:hypothetical protein